MPDVPHQLESPDHRIIVVNPTYADTDEHYRQPTALEGAVHSLFLRNADYIVREVDPNLPCGVTETLVGTHSGWIAEKTASIERVTYPYTGEVNRIVINGLNGINFSRGRIWSDERGNVWQRLSNTDSIQRYPAYKLPLLNTRIRSLDVTGRYL